jgi:hypothetical protein
MPRIPHHLRCRSSQRRKKPLWQGKLRCLLGRPRSRFGGPRTRLKAPIRGQGVNALVEIDNVSLVRDPSSPSTLGKEAARFPAEEWGISIYCALHKLRQRYSIAVMAALPNNLRLAVCGRCGQVMPLIRTVPRIGVLPEMHVFVCSSCGEVETVGIPQQTQKGVHDISSTGKILSHKD